MPVECPQCLSPRIKKRNLGKQIGATIGAVVGAVAGAVSQASGIRMKAGIPLINRPGGIPGAMAGALTGGLAGSATGATLGELIDTEFLDTHLCLSCGNTFRSTRTERPLWDHR